MCYASSRHGAMVAIRRCVTPAGRPRKGPSMRLSQVKLTLGLFASMSACSLTTSFDGLMGGVPGGVTSDADVRADADTGTDAVAGDRATGPSCATSRHVFCADFDDSDRRPRWR
jgi:hypothetical protein